MARRRLVVEGATLEAVELLAASAGVSPGELIVRALRREDEAQRPGGVADVVPVADRPDVAAGSWLHLGPPPGLGEAAGGASPGVSGVVDLDEAIAHPPRRPRNVGILVADGNVTLLSGEYVGRRVHFPKSVSASDFTSLLVDVLVSIAVGDEVTVSEHDSSGSWVLSFVSLSFDSEIYALLGQVGLRISSGGSSGPAVGGIF